MSSSYEFDESNLPDPNARPDRHPPLESRADRVARIRAEIASGEYETPERLDAALERMVQVLDLS